MTQEQFERAVAIWARLKDLEELKKEIAEKAKHRLTYCYIASSGDYKEVNVWKVRCIDKYLDKYDNQIRKDIDDEINALHKEIEEL